MGQKQQVLMSQYSNIDQNINRFLVGKSRQNPFNFIPFKVEVVNKSPRESGLSQLRSLYCTAYCSRKVKPNYMNPIKSRKKEGSLSNQQLAPLSPPREPTQKQRKMDLSLRLQNLYSREYLEPDKITRTAFSSQGINPRKKLSLTSSGHRPILPRESKPTHQDQPGGSVLDRFKELLSSQPHSKVRELIRTKRSHEVAHYKTYAYSFKGRRYD